MAGFERILIICPPHLVPKWKREVEQTVPGVRAAIVESITGLERLRLSIGSGSLFAVMSREKGKLSYRWKAAVIERWAVSMGRLVREEETGEPFRAPCCPDCTAQVTATASGAAGRMLLPSLQTIQRTSSSYQNGSPLPPVHCRRWDISHEQLVWTFMLVNYAKWYSFTPSQRPSFPPPLTSQIVLSNCISDHIPLGPRYRYVGVAQRLLYRI